MNSTNIRGKFDNFYSKHSIDFANAVGELDASGIPEPHLPHWGKMYDTASLKIGLIGRDTRSWGDMNDFLRAVKNDPVGAIHRHEEEFDSLAFTEWTNNFGKTFWDTSMKFLAGLHGISDWKRLKRREEEAVLRSFFWANVNSVERYEASPQANAVSLETWRIVKNASEQHLDSFSALLNIFIPHVIILMNWDPNDRFLDIPLQWEEFGDHQAYSFHEPTGTHILATAHPTWLNQHSLYEIAVNGIINRAKKALDVTC